MVRRLRTGGRDLWSKPPRQHAILTAENPHGRALSAEANALRQERLRFELDQRHLTYQPAVGAYRDELSGQLLHEHPFVVKDMTPGVAARLGQKFGQNSVVTTKGFHDLPHHVLHPSSGVTATNTAPYTKIRRGHGFAHKINWSKSQWDVSSEPRDEHGRWTTA